MVKVWNKTIKKFCLFKKVVPKVQHLKLMLVAWYFLRLDIGTQVSSIKYNTVAALSLLGQISDNNINVRTANGQDMGIKGSVMVNFKIGPSSFAHKSVVCEGLTRPFILGQRISQSSLFYSRLDQ